MLYTYETLQALTTRPWGSMTSGLSIWSNSIHFLTKFDGYRSQSRQAIQVLDEARDAVQTMHVGPTTIITGSVDGHVRTYDLRKGELRADFIGRKLSTRLIHPIQRSHMYFDYYYRTNNISHPDHWFPNSSCIYLGLECTASRPLHGQDAQYIYGTQKLWVQSPCMFRGSRGQRYLRRWRRQGMGLGFGRCKLYFPHILYFIILNTSFCTQATVLQPNPPPKVHERVITWTEHHPTDPGEMITASADGTCKVWRHASASIGA